MVDTSFVKKLSIWLLDPVLGESFSLSEENKLLKWNKVTWLPDKAAHMQPEPSKQLRVCASVSNERNLIYTRLRYYRGSVWGHSRIRALLGQGVWCSRLWSFSGVFLGGLCLESDGKPKDTLQNKNRLNTHTLTITHFLRLIYLSVCS